MKQEDKEDRNFGFVDEDNRIEWKELNVKDKIAYIMAIVLIVSGIIMAFCCFFMTEEHDVNDGVLWYCSQAFVCGGGLLGISVWIKGKVGELNNYIDRKLNKRDE